MPLKQQDVKRLKADAKELSDSYKDTERILVGIEVLRAEIARVQLGLELARERELEAQRSLDLDLGKLENAPKSQVEPFLAEAYSGTYFSPEPDEVITVKWLKDIDTGVRDKPVEKLEEAITQAIETPVAPVPDYITSADNMLKVDAAPIEPIGAPKIGGKK